MTREKSGRKEEVRQKQPARLAGKLDAGLLTYAIAASAAGIGMMAQTQAAEAEVVATAANIPVPYGGGLVQFDINRDGQMDFGLSWGNHNLPGHHRKTCSTNCPPPESSAGKVVPAQAANEIWQSDSKAGFFGNSLYCAAPLKAGRRVGPTAVFKAGSKALFWNYENVITGGFSACSFGRRAPHDPYLGVKFLDTSGNVHYGWVRVSLVGGVTITGYAYETIANKGINTGVTHGAVDDAGMIGPSMINPSMIDPALTSDPAPASLGVLALGADGLTAWRRMEEEQQPAA